LALVSLALAVPPAWHNGPCGQSKYPDAGNQPLPPFRKIVGGIDAREFEFPWQTSMRRASTDSHFCGGSIINSEWVITAAHCMSGETPNQVSVVIGEHDRNDGSNGVRQSLDVVQIVVNPNYNPVRLTNDVALVRVATPIAFNENIQPICGPEPTDLFEYRYSLCSGWGTLSSGGACCPAILKYVSLNVTTNTFCDAEYTTDQITADMICASDNNGGNDRDSCQGDSGGPLMVKDGNNIFTLVGLVSWGIGCASGYPGVYARTTAFHDWILSVINP